MLELPRLRRVGLALLIFEEVGDIIATALIQGTSGSVDVDGLRARVRALTDAHPLYAGLNQ